jgi:hypothetical protein
MIWEDLCMRLRLIILPLLACALFAALPLLAKAQSSLDATDPSVTTAGTNPVLPDGPYDRPTEKTRFRNYAFDAYGPLAIGIAAVEGGIDQEDNAPSEWKQGAAGYSKRFGSDFAIGAVSTTARYALSGVFKEDALYYRCECTGLFPRLRHAAISTLMARRGDDGHRVFSFPALVAPYAGSMAAVYGWYPSRYDARDAFRMGNYTLLGYVGANISLEFLSNGPHSLLSRWHLNNAHGTPDPESNQ